MKLFRNREIRQFTLIYCLLCLPFVIGGFYLSRPAGILLLGLALCLYGLWFLDASRRYRGMERLAHQLDQILHSHTAASLSKYQEGELSLLENEINKLLTRLWEQTDLQEKDKRYLADSMADISHQLRTGLTTIHLALSSLGEDDLPASRQLGYRREISRQLSRMDWLVSALLKLSKLDAGTIQFHPVPVSFADLVGRGTEPLQIPMELKGQALVTDLSGSVFCDPAWTGEAIGNILKNCTEHMGEGTLSSLPQKIPCMPSLSSGIPAPALIRRIFPTCSGAFTGAKMPDRTALASAWPFPERSCPLRTVP